MFHQLDNMPGLDYILCLKPTSHAIVLGHRLRPIATPMMKQKQNYYFRPWGSATHKALSLENNSTADPAQKSLTVE